VVHGTEWNGELSIKDMLPKKLSWEINVSMNGSRDCEVRENCYINCRPDLRRLFKDRKSETSGVDEGRATKALHFIVI
jgi:hypothetical protein